MAMALVSEGHISQAIAMKEQDFFLAWGDLGENYPDVWTLNEIPPVATSTIYSETITRGGTAGGSDNLTQTGVQKIVSVVDENSVEYTQDVDYILDAGTVNWSLDGDEPASGVDYTVVYRHFTEDVNTLVNEVGRRIVSQKEFVVEDNVNGTIVFNDKRWRIVNDPTPHVYLSFNFQSDEATDVSIYQLGLYTNTIVDPILPPGQQYFVPAEINDPGSAYMLENVQPFPRNAGKREVFEFVISF
jgi:hypothetical protein